jgi:acetyltransferase-like isoleucine patch superfamily enzyme
MKNPFDGGYFDELELRQFGIRAVGHNVRIAKHCTIIGLENVAIADDVRIDPYTTIIATNGGSLTIGSNVHIGGYCHLSCGEGLRLGDFSGLSQGVRVYTRTDDYSGKSLTNPTVPPAYVRALGGPVTIGRHAIIGAGTVVLPRLTIAEGCSVGAMSLVKEDLEAWGVYAGCPARRLKSRSQDLLDMEQNYLADKRNSHR